MDIQQAKHFQEMVRHIGGGYSKMPRDLRVIPTIRLAQRKHLSRVSRHGLKAKEETEQFVSRHQRCSASQSVRSSWSPSTFAARSG
jgi:hypothetical protein